MHMGHTFNTILHFNTSSSLAFFIPAFEEYSYYQSDSESTEITIFHYRIKVENLEVICGLKGSSIDEGSRI